MQALEIARRLVELGQNEEACRAYKLALQQENKEDPAFLMEAALYILQFGQGNDYQISYTIFHDLYNGGCYQEDILQVMDMAFYEPNVKQQKDFYKQNRRLLNQYSYLFRKDFLEFDQLPIRFYPFDDSSYTPFFVAEGRFGEFVKPAEPVIRHHFFKDLENPILAKDVYSQYELEYLRDNVRKSEYVGRENHIYLHYSSWGEFCAWLSVLDLRPVLEEKKVVFLIEDEISQYPIDFKERFGIDYSKFPVRPIGIREINRMIWHTQLSAHNGGDFFNEIFDSHPNLLALPSVMMRETEEHVKKIGEDIKKISSLEELHRSTHWPKPQVLTELYMLRNRTLKDILVALYLNGQEKETSPFLDKNSRIAPVLFFQPHFGKINYNVGTDKAGHAILDSPSYDQICESPLFRDFKYIKTFTPIRRPTTSYGASMRFIYPQTFLGGNLGGKEDARPSTYAADSIHWLTNRSYMIDWQNRLFKDCALVRFEDGKLNPKATFTALAAFLDIPYTESMTYCSQYGERDPESYKGNARGFDPVAVYRTYDEFVDDNARYFLEYFLRDVYQEYGYDFLCYDGAELDEEKIDKLLQNLNIENRLTRESWDRVIAWAEEENAKRPEEEKQAVLAKKERWLQVNASSLEVKELLDYFLMVDPHKTVENHIEKLFAQRRKAAMTLLKSLEFVNRNGQPLHMMPKLELDPALLEQPLYH